ncbi:MAG: DUF3240 domain-containing protein [Sedimenticola selenatireducens]|uniref:DUF3240 domain-containing protein n=2 Tax=Sedimenticola selenatireducens TaxID=191960 RepID=A0A558E1N9_9GAMM|nr:DUF3240 domain-containing protein [Sedimenticola selenatireducens]TVT67049.1 MAG: DUF3240 domain-containing protein [Sedimenticola selenatireducens]
MGQYNIKVKNVKMKILTILIHSEAQQALLDKIRSLKEVNGFTFSHAEGHGTHVEDNDFLAARDKVVGHSARLRVDMLLDNLACEKVIAMLKESKGPLKGHTVFWVTATETSGHI